MYKLCPAIRFRYFGQLCQELKLIFVTTATTGVPKLTNIRSFRNQSSFLPFIHFTEEKGWISVTSVVVCDDYPGYENILSWLFKFFRLYVKIKVSFYFVPVEVNFSG